MRALPSIHYCQKGALPDDSHPYPGHFIPADTPPAGGRMIDFDLLLPIEKVIRPFHCRRTDGSRRRPAHFLSVQQASQFFADRSFHHRCLSSSSSAAGSDNASRWSHVRGKLSQELGQIGQGRSHHD